MVCEVLHGLGHKIQPRAFLKWQLHAGFRPGRREL